jgi:DNA repair protein REV1
LTTSNLDAFLSTLSVKSLPGVGWHIEEKMKEELKVDTVGGLKAIRRSEMQRVLGETNGIKFGNFAAGIDTTELTIDSIRKSVSAEVNYGIRFSSDTAHVSEVERFMRQLGMEVSARLKSYGNLKARSITLKVLIRHPDSDKETPKFLGHGWHTTTNATRPISGPGNTASDDGVVIGELAWGLLKELNIAPEELRGLAIKASRLETNGVSHDVVMERGQGVLQFATATKKNVAVDPAIIPKVDTSPVDDINNEDDIIDSSPPLFESPPPNQQHASTSALALPLPKHTTRNVIASTSKLPDVIILSDSSDSDRSPQPKRRRTDAASVAPKSPSKLHPVARIFKKVKQHSARSTSRDGSGSTASQIMDEDLKELNILEVEMFRNLPREIQDDQLAHAFRTIKGLELKKKLKKEEKKPEKGKLDFTISKPTTLLVTKKPPVVPLAFKAPPLSLHPNLHIDTFRELDLDTQREQIRNYARLKLLSVPGNRPIGARPNSKSGPVIQSIRMAIVPAPSFDKAVELDEIQGKITNWFDACTKVEPHVDDVQILILFIKKCLDKKLGQDLTKMMGVMKWWKYLIETEFGEEGIDSSKNKVGRAWWKGWNEAKKAVDQVVKKEFGSIVDL